MSFLIKTIILLILTTSIAISQSHQNTEAIPLNSTQKLELVNVKANVVRLKGKEGIRVEKKDSLDKTKRTETLVLIEGTNFRNGIIKLELAGEPAPDAGKGARGFVGIAFRIDSSDHSNYECLYLRPVNGRADDQLQRNHSVQYIAHPEYPWQRLRKEHPGQYETYVDLVPGEWTKIKIEVSGQKARLYIHGSSHPTLIVNDLKHNERTGLVGLWLHRSTVAHYRNLKLTVFSD